MLVLNLMPATHLKQVRSGATKGKESSITFQKHLFPTGFVETGGRIRIGSRLRPPLCQAHDCLKDIMH